MKSNGKNPLLFMFIIYGGGHTYLLQRTMINAKKIYEHLVLRKI